jgi:recombination DNA repair RAD52 pathway protein
MDKNIRQILERPFSHDLIRTREGPGGMTLAYVEVQAYIDRLNEAFGGDWSFELISREQVEDQLIVEGRLTAGGVVKTGLGGAAVTRRKDNGKLVSLADDCKKAEADALKRCCRLLGVGSELYGVEVCGEIAEEPREQKAEARTDDATNRVSQAQIGKIRHLIADLGLDWASFRTQVRDAQGVNVEFITKKVASSIIDELLQQTRSGKRRPNGNGSGRYA